VSAEHNDDSTAPTGATPTGPAPAGSAGGGRSKGGKAEPEQPPVVIRDKRRIDPTGKVRGSAKEPAAGAEPASAETGAAQPSPDDPAKPPAAEPTQAEPTQPEATQPEPADAEPDQSTGDGPDGELVVDGEVVEPGDPAFDQELADLLAKDSQRTEGRPFAAELESLRAELDERTRDLQRVTAEYANYRKRVDRDRGLAGEQATAAVVAALLPVLDDLDRARGHGDLTGPFATMAEALTATLGKFGLTAFGEKGDPFDPTRHEAVAHLTSAEVTEPSCIDVMRRGYLLGDRLLRPAMVAVADPAE
jgi:molecular chaperone GrpE